jgi:multiple sugar transport system ATP-binding protein
VQSQLDQLEKDLDGEAMRTQLVVALDASSRIQKGEDAMIWMDGSRMHLFDPKSGDNLTHGL